ncbi:unnamed protein product [Macrosiphum euphorbiae]|nr:unnamed protein product [Macrosiphum euphorbiae]
MNNNSIYAFETCRRAHISRDAGAAVIVLTNRYQSILLGAYSSSHTVAIRVRFGPRQLDDVILVSSYFKYNTPTILHIERLSQIMEKEKRILIGVDTNGHSKLWFSETRNRRGRTVDEFIHKYGLRVHNIAGQMNTFRRRDNRTSNIDVTLTTADIGHKVRNWLVSDETDSDHRVISYNLLVRKPPPRIPGPVRYNAKTADWDLFNTTLLGEVGRIPCNCINAMAAGITLALTTAADKAMMKKRLSGGLGKNPWWSPELASLRKDLVRKRRQGLNRPEYNTLRNSFLTAIRKHKADTWKNYANELNTNPWSRAFSWAKKGSRPRSIPSTLTKEDGSQTVDCLDTVELILDKFVPRDPQQGELVYQGPLEYTESLDPESIKVAIWRIKPSGAPGMDGISARMLRKAWPALREPITHLFGQCVKAGQFPDCWKTAELVLVPKPGATDASLVKSFRPISLLPVLGKTLETIIIGKIINETTLDSHVEQHGFTTGKSTSGALEAVYDWVDASSSRHIFGTFLDITGAFDNVKWSPLLSQLIHLGASLGTVRIVQSYLTNRWANFHMEGVWYRRMLERGCPQGSQLGPTLWKVAITPIYGSVISPDSTKILTYADDILLMVGAARPKTAFNRIEKQLDKFTTWATEFALEFSAGKTQLLSLKGGLKPGYSIAFGTAADAPRIESSPTAKYLGVVLDPRRSYWDHVLSVCKKSDDMYSRLRALYSANWGMGQSAANTIYKGVFLPRIAYAAEIWAEGSKLRKSRAKLLSAQRKPLLAITGAYRTASTNCLSAVAGTLPLDLEIRHQAALRNRARERISADEMETITFELLNEWQDRYTSTNKGSWTQKMIPSVRQRYHLPLDLDHYTTQFLTGHGDFKAKLYGFKLVNDPICECDRKPETVNHVLRFCSRTVSARRKLKTTMREEGEAWPPENGAFLKSRRTFQALKSFAREALTNRIDR